jgi:ABC-2 type transport system permease protein
MNSWLRDVATVARHECRLLRSDPFPVVVLIGMPLIVIAFITPAYNLAFASLTKGRLTGATQSVPGISVTFAFFVVSYIGFAMFREHGWGTWQRLRAAPVHPLALLAGKALPPFALAVLQQALLLTAGTIFFGLKIAGSVPELGIVTVSFSICLVMLGMALSAFARTLHQVNSTANLGAMICAGLGGALTPVATLPGWARGLAPFVPSYWALRGYRSVILDSGLAAVLLSSAVLVIFAVLFAVLFGWRFAFDEHKTAWA